MIQFTRSAKAFFFDRAAVINAIDAKTHKAMNHIGGRIKVTAQRSMRSQSRPKKGPMVAKPSKPGKPPMRRGPIGTGLTEIIYVYEPSKRRVQIGPVKANWDAFPEATVPEVHEFGRTVSITEAEFRIASQGETKTEWRQVTKRGAARARANNRRLRRRSVQYPKRPFMAPALEKNTKFIRDRWSDAATSVGV